MNKITYFFKRFLSFQFKLIVGINVFNLIGFIPHLVAAQDFTSITWGTAKAQSKGTHEVHGEVVNGKLYIFGGFDVNKRPSYTPTKRSYMYDPVADTWTPIADLPHTPNGAGFGGITHVGLTNDGTNIFFAGGYTSNADGTGQIFGTKQVWRYNVSSNDYTRLPDLPQALAAGQMRYLNGKLHYAGGANLSRADIGVHYALDLNNLSAGWVSLAPLLNPVNHPGSAVYNGKLYFVGGAHHQDKNTVTQNTLEVYNDSTDTWTKLADLPVARDHISSAVIVAGTRILVLGGETSHNVLSKLVSAYSPASNTWEELTPLPAGRSAGVAAFLNGNIYYTGGNFSNVNRKGVPVVQTGGATLLPVADAYVRSGTYSALNYGNDTSLVAKGASDSNYVRTSYLKFSLSSVSNISSATLRLYGSNTDNTNIINLSAFATDNDSWTETGITFKNAPTATTAALSTAAITNQPAYYEFDVTGYVKSQFTGDKIVSLLVKDVSKQNSKLVFNSKENANNKPQLIITSAANRSDNIDVSQPLLLTDNNSVFKKDSKTPAVYPNPLEKRFHIKFPAGYAKNISLEMADGAGRIYNIGQMKINMEVADMDVDVSKFELKPGVYFLRIFADTKIEEIKLVIK